MTNEYFPEVSGWKNFSDSRHSNPNIEKIWYNENQKVWLQILNAEGPFEELTQKYVVEKCFDEEHERDGKIIIAEKSSLGHAKQEAYNTARKIND